MGFEPTTASLEGWNSTTELRPPVFFPQSQTLPYTSQPPSIKPQTPTHHKPDDGGQARIRTLEADGNRFTVCPLWPLGYLPKTPRTINLQPQLSASSSSHDEERRVSWSTHISPCPYK